MYQHLKIKTEEKWAIIPEFPTYEVSSYGNIRNMKTDRIMRTSRTAFGHIKITLTSDYYGWRKTRGVAQLVAEAFIEKPSMLCDQVMILDGDFDNVASDNLVWRPRWYAWKYTHQIKMAQPLHYRNLPVINIVNECRYSSIIVAGMTEGLLFDEIWRSTYTGAKLFPFEAIFDVVEFRV